MGKPQRARENAGNDSACKSRDFDGVRDDDDRDTVGAIELEENFHDLGAGIWGVLFSICSQILNLRLNLCKAAKIRQGTLGVRSQCVLRS